MGSPKEPKKDPPQADPRIQQAALEEAARRRQGKGYRSTVLSEFASQSVGGKQTLGA